MPDAPFLIGLEPADGSTAAPSNLRPLVVDVRRKASGVRLPYVLGGDAPPQQPSVFLQIWHLGKFEASRLKQVGQGSYLKDDPILQDVEGTNDLLIEIPGFIQQTEAGFQFRVAGAPARGNAPSLGWLRLQLNDAAGNAWPDASGLTVPITSGGAEDELDLACGLYARSGNADPPDDKVAFHCANLTHVIGSQVAEGGIFGLFYSRFSNSKDSNDAAFAAFARIFARKYHSLGLRSGELIIGGTGLDTWNDFKSGIGALRDKVKAGFPAAGEAKLKRLVIMTHGIQTAIAWGSQEQWMGNGNIDLIADTIAPHCTADVLVTLFACSAGHGGAPFAGTPAPGQALGAGSFAEKLLAALQARGLSDAAVWAHVVAGHATLNSELRAFTKAGVMDIVWAVEDPGFGGSSPAGSWVGRFASAGGAARPKALYLELAGIVHPGEAVAQRRGTT